MAIDEVITGQVLKVQQVYLHGTPPKYVYRENHLMSVGHAYLCVNLESK